MSNPPDRRMQQLASFEALRVNRIDIAIGLWRLKAGGPQHARKLGATQVALAGIDARSVDGLQSHVRVCSPEDAHHSGSQ